MKLTIGDNIRRYRKELGLTQDQLADKLGVTYQSVSRWENGSTYPDIEFLPAIANAFSITIDRLLGMPEAEKEQQAEEAFDDLCRECKKQEYDCDRIIALLQDIRRNHMNSSHAWRPWCDGSSEAFRDPRILPEARLFAEAALALDPSSVQVIQIMAAIEDEEHIEEFLKKHSTATDCSKSALLYLRYRWSTKDSAKFDTERRYRLYCSINNVLDQNNLIGHNITPEKLAKMQEFKISFLKLIRSDGADTQPDIWTNQRLSQELDYIEQLISENRTEEALKMLSSWVELLENTMRITDEVMLPTSCKWLDGMVWTAKESWHSPDNHPDSAEERIIFISTRIDDLTLCNCIYPSVYYNQLISGSFDPLRKNSKFASLTERVKALIVTRPQK